MEENITPEKQEDQVPPTGEPAAAADIVPAEVPAEAPIEVSGVPAEVDPLIEPEAKVPEEPVTEAKEPEVAVPEVKPIVGERKWYVIQTFTGQEDKAKKALEQTIQDEGLKDRVFQVLVPVEDVVEIKGGKRVERVNKMFPGYVFIDMVLDDTTWYMIRQTNGVARFIGSKVQPTPVSEKEMQRVLKQLGKQERLEVSFERGEGVRVISGPFRGYTGTIDELNSEKGKMKVLINIFGRDTPVEVNFEHAQKIN